jgi:hypothetical protein
VTGDVQGCIKNLCDDKFINYGAMSNDVGMKWGIDVTSRRRNCFLIPSAYFMFHIIVHHKSKIAYTLQACLSTGNILQLVLCSKIWNLPMKCLEEGLFKISLRQQPKWRQKIEDLKSLTELFHIVSWN